MQHVLGSSTTPLAGSRYEHMWRRLTCTVLGIYAILILTTFRSYGVTYDESLQSDYGDQILQWYSGHAPLTAIVNPYTLIHTYGGFFDVVAQFAVRLSPLGLYETRHLASAVFGFLGVLFASRLAAYLAGPAAGFLAALFLILTPAYYGDAFNNPKDAPFAALAVVALYYMVTAIRSLPRLTAVDAIKLGLAIGLAMGIRIGGIILLAYLALGMVMWLILDLTKQETWESVNTRLRSVTARLTGTYLGVVLLAWGAMLAFWPWGQANPVLNPLTALRIFDDYPMRVEIFFQGQDIWSNEAPHAYLLKFLSVKLPEFYLVAGLAIIPLGMLLLRRWWRNPGVSARFVEYTLLIVAGVFPVVYATVKDPSAYDGLRHFLFILPPLAILSPVILVQLARALRYRGATLGLAAAILASVVATGSEMIRLHPYEYVFYNRVIGHGVAEASRLYETDYWGESYKEGAEWILTHIPASPVKTNVVVCGPTSLASPYLPADKFDVISLSDFNMASTSKAPALYLAITRWHCPEALDGRVIDEVSRDDTPLLYVKAIGITSDVAHRP